MKATLYRTTCVVFTKLRVTWERVQGERGGGVGVKQYFLIVNIFSVGFLKNFFQRFLVSSLVKTNTRSKM